jgi:hypothetical protein
MFARAACAYQRNALALPPLHRPMPSHAGYCLRDKTQTRARDAARQCRHCLHDPAPCCSWQGFASGGKFLHARAQVLRGSVGIVSMIQCAMLFVSTKSG